jgi:hypothetical protein
MPIVINSVLGDLTILSETEEEEEEMEAERKQSIEDEPEENCNPRKTFVKKVKYHYGTKIKYEPIFDLNLMPHFGPVFELPAPVQSLALSMINLYYPDSL